MAPEQQLEEAGKFYVKIVDRERVKMSIFVEFYK